MESKALMTMTEKTMLERIDVAKFPQALRPEEKKMLAMVAISYGFDPLMGEITVFQGRPYVSIDGRYRKAQETGIFNGITSRPATKQEREEWQIPDGDYFVKSTVEIKGGGHFDGWGRVYASETKGGKGYTPVEKNPQRMAEKRGDAQALRKAFHIPLPSFEERGTPEDEAVNVQTGEIIESKAVVIDEKQAEQDIKDFFPESEPDMPTVPKVNAVVLAVINELLKNKDNKERIKAEIKKNGWKATKPSELSQPQAEILLGLFPDIEETKKLGAVEEN